MHSPSYSQASKWSFRFKCGLTNNYISLFLLGISLLPPLSKFFLHSILSWGVTFNQMRKKKIKRYFTCKKMPSRNKSNFQPTIIYFDIYVVYVLLWVFKYPYFSRRGRAAIVTICTVQQIQWTVLPLATEFFWCKIVKLYLKIGRSRMAEMKSSYVFGVSYHIESKKVPAVQVGCNKLQWFKLNWGIS